MNKEPTKEQLQQQVAAAQETIQSLSKRMRQMESKHAQLPFQQQLQSYQQRIAEKSEALKRAQNWSELIIEHAMDAIVRLDQQGCIQSWNPMAERMFGYGEQEVLGLLIEHTILPKRLHQANLKHFHRHLKRGTGALMNRRIEGVACCKDGTELPVEFVGSVVKQGEEMAYAMVFRDISERKSAEQQLRDSHTNLEQQVAARTGEVRNLASIIEASVNMVAMADLSGKVLYLNPAGKDMLGLKQDVSLSTLKVNQFHSPKMIQKFNIEILPQALEQGVCITQCEFLDVDGKSIPVDCTFMSLPDADGKPARLAVISRDLRKEMALQQQIEHVDRLESLGILAGGIAHDFNNILTAVLGNVGMAMRKIDSSSSVHGYLHNIEQSSLQAANLCKQMLAYSGKGSFVIKPLNLSDLIEDMRALLEISIDKNVILNVDLEENLPLVEADVTQMQQVVLNLVINASEAMGQKNGVITILTSVMRVDDAYLKASLHQQDITAGRFVYLQVLDSGCGMDAETRKKIFDPFFTTKFTGRGLGMSAVLGIVHGHKGLLNVYSEPNKGTSFKIALPVSASSKEAFIETQTVDDMPHGSGLILIIDDDETIREIAKMIFEELGFDVLIAVDGQDGVDVFQQHKDDITGVLLDMTMPRMNGDACYRALRHIKPNIKVILSSGYSEEDATEHFKGKDLAGFIQKPYLIDDFQALMMQCFSDGQ